MQVERLPRHRATPCRRLPRRANALSSSDRPATPVKLHHIQTIAAPRTSICLAICAPATRISRDAGGRGGAGTCASWCTRWAETRGTWYVAILAELVRDAIQAEGVPARFDMIEVRRSGAETQCVAWALAHALRRVSNLTSRLFRARHVLLQWRHIELAPAQRG